MSTKILKQPNQGRVVSSLPISEDNFLHKNYKTIQNFIEKKRVDFKSHIKNQNTFSLIEKSVVEKFSNLKNSKDGMLKSSIITEIYCFCKKDQ